jgi:thymidylate synthase
VEIKAETQSDAWVAVIGELLDAPVVSPRGMRVKEIPERVTVRIAYPEAGFVEASGRKLNHAITAVEGLSLVGQCSVPELILERVGAFAPYADDGIFWGAYGPRAAGDLGLVVELLRRDPDSRQAVISIYDSDRDLGRSARDIPCTLALQFFVRGGRLDAWAVMRSQDAWLGMPYDFGQFTMLQFAVAQALGIAPGVYTHTLGSLHLYEKHWDAAADVRDPRAVAHGSRYGGVDSVASIASRCRRLLLGRDLSDSTSLERWLHDLMVTP